MRSQRVSILLFTGVFLVASAAAEHAVPTPVSPGTTRGAGIAIADRCPTFSWGESPSAKSYELTVYRAGDDGLEVRPVFTESISATALSWTPSLARCLEAGGRYAWSVRSVHGDGESDWSEPSLFQVVAAPDGDGDRKVPAPWTLSAPDEAGSAETDESKGGEGEAGLQQDRAAQAAATAGTKLSVDGNVDATSFSGDGSLLTSVDAETLDTFGSAAFLQKSEADTETEFEELLSDVTNILTDTEIATAATALATDGADCPPGEFAAGVDASGAAQGCAVPADAHAFATRNTEVGAGALASNTTGTDSTANGSGALFYNTTGSGNTASGSSALFKNTTGSGNTASGRGALGYNTTGYDNAAHGFNALPSNTTGSINTASGVQALRDNTTGSSNTAAGFAALGANTSGGSNTASGAFALNKNTTGTYHTGVGAGALLNTTGDRNTALGSGAGSSATTGSDNIFLGSGAAGTPADANTTRIGGTSVGAGSGQQNRAFINGIRGVSVAGGQPVVIDASGQLGSTAGGAGSAIDADTLDTLDSTDFLQKTEADTEAELEALLGDVTNVLTDTEIAAAATTLATDGADCPAGEFAAGVDASGAAQGCAVPADVHVFATRNTKVGEFALASNTTSDRNTAVGYQALFFNTTGSNNTASGSDALFYNTTGYGNTASGTNALFYNTTGSGNTASGYAALRYNTTGNSNTASGHGALHYNTTGNSNAASGNSALFQNTTGYNNTASGYAALRYNTTGNSNTASGNSALFQNTTGYNNTASGGSALFYNTTGSSNTASGGGALFQNTTGYNNTASGSGALGANTAGHDNAGHGFQALSSNTTGLLNTASGVQALRDNTTGSENTATGFGALGANTSGGSNTASGAFALNNNTTSHYNTALGFGAGANAATGSYNIFIGNGAYPGDAGKIRLGTPGTHINTYVAGVRGVMTGVADAIPVLIDSAGQLGTVSSSRRYKQDIRDMAEVSERLLALRPVTFRYRKGFADGETPVQFGLIAEEVAEVFPELVVYNEKGEPETVKYHVLSSMLLNELQKLRVRVRRLEPLEARLDRLEALVAESPRLAAEGRPPPRDKTGTATSRSSP